MQKGNKGTTNRGSSDSRKNTPGEQGNKSYIGNRKGIQGDHTGATTTTSTGPKGPENSKKSI